jgi:hypothetical protein
VLTPKVLTPRARKTPLSLRAYARRRGVSVEAVRRAIQRGRLSASLSVDAQGKTKIADPKLADREWSKNTDLSKAPGYVKARPAVVAEADSGVTPAPGTPVTPVIDGDEPQSLLGASTAEKHWKTRIAELDYKKKAGLLLDAGAVIAWKTEVLAEMSQAYTRCRSKLLGIPTRAKAALPHLKHTDIRAIDDLLRDALEELASSAPGAVA